MRKLLLMMTMLALGTACPKVQQKVYSFDMRAKTGTLVFKNIYSDEPLKRNNDFMEIVNNVIEGAAIEQDHPGWTIDKKELFVEGEQLSGRASFRFANPTAAGVYKHDKKSPYIWCMGRSEELGIVATNGVMIPELPGCVAWDRRAKQLTVTVKMSELDGAVEPLIEPYQRWSKGETLELVSGLGVSGESIEDFGTKLVQGLTDRFTSVLADGTVFEVGTPEVGKEHQQEVERRVGATVVSALKLCLLPEANTTQALSEVIEVRVQPDGSSSTVVGQSPDGKSRVTCYAGALGADAYAPSKKGWRYTISVGFHR